MNEVKLESAGSKPKNQPKAKYSALVAGSLLLLAGARNAAADTTPLPLRSEANGAHIHNCVTSQTIETGYGTNLLGLAFAGTTTYDFYSPPLGASVNLAPGDHGGGTIYLQNGATGANNDFSVSGRMQFFDYDPATGTQTPIMATAASDATDVNHGQTVNWEIPVAQLDVGTTIPAGHMVHIAMTIELVSGNPGNGGRMLYNGPENTSTFAFFQEDHSDAISLTLVPGAMPPPAHSVVSLMANGTAQICSSGTAGETYLIQATTNLSLASSWVTISTNVLGTNGVCAFIDRDATNYPCRFYRFAAP